MAVRDYVALVGVAHRTRLAFANLYQLTLEGRMMERGVLRTQASLHKPAQARARVNRPQGPP
eukprot:1209842-Pyramimonas_sp.AAC.1